MDRAPMCLPRTACTSSTRSSCRNCSRVANNLSGACGNQPPQRQLFVRRTPLLGLHRLHLCCGGGGGSLAADLDRTVICDMRALNFQHHVLLLQHARGRRQGVQLVDHTPAPVSWHLHRLPAALPPLLSVQPCSSRCAVRSPGEGRHLEKGAEALALQILPPEPQRADAAEAATQLKFSQEVANHRLWNDVSAYQEQHSGHRQLRHRFCMLHSTTDGSTRRLGWLHASEPDFAIPAVAPNVFRVVVFAEGNSCN